MTDVADTLYPGSYTGSVAGETTTGSPDFTVSGTGQIAVVRPLPARLLLPRTPSYLLQPPVAGEEFSFRSAETGSGTRQLRAARSRSARSRRMLSPAEEDRPGRAVSSELLPARLQGMGRKYRRRVQRATRRASSSPAFTDPR